MRVDKRTMDDGRGGLASTLMSTRALATKFDEDCIPRARRRVPRVTDTLHRRHYTFLALSRLFAPFYNIFTLLYPSPEYSTRSRLQRVHRFAEARAFATLLLFRRPYPSPHRLCCVLSICIYILFRILTLLHVLHLFPFYIQIITHKVGIKTL